MELTQQQEHHAGEVARTFIALIANSGPEEFNQDEASKKMALLVVTMKTLFNYTNEEAKAISDRGMDIAFKQMELLLGPINREEQ